MKEGSSLFLGVIGKGREGEGVKVARRSNAIPISARTSREPTIPPYPRRPQDEDLILRCGRARQAGWWRGWIVEAKGVPLRAGWLVEWADMYAVSAPPTGPPSWNRCRSSGRKELLRSSGAAEVYPPLLCVCAPPHTPHSSPLLPVCHLMLPPRS